METLHRVASVLVRKNQGQLFLQIKSALNISTHVQRFIHPFAFEFVSIQIYGQEQLVFDLRYNPVHLQRFMKPLI
jgi:hypothetical protein